MSCPDNNRSLVTLPGILQMTSPLPQTHHMPLFHRPNIDACLQS